MRSQDERGIPPCRLIPGKAEEYVRFAWFQANLGTITRRMTCEYYKRSGRVFCSGINACSIRELNSYLMHFTAYCILYSAHSSRAIPLSKFSCYTPIMLPVYKRLPKGTPDWLTVCILLLGGGLGIAISVYALIGLYGLTGFLVNFFFAGSNFVIDPKEAIYLGVVGVTGSLATVLISYLAVYMNGLSKRAIPLSRIVWIPCAATFGLMMIGRQSDGFMYVYNDIWFISAIVGLICAGLLPWLLLRTKAARKIHSR